MSNVSRPPRNTADHWPALCQRGGPNEHDGIAAQAKRDAMNQRIESDPPTDATSPTALLRQLPNSTLNWLFWMPKIGAAFKPPF
jgi:hypothetical protein